MKYLIKNINILLLVSIFQGCCNEKSVKHDNIKIDLKEAKKDSIIILKKIKLDKKCFSDFNLFFSKFSKDSIFQEKRVRFPLKLTYYNYDESDDAKIKFIKKNEYKFIDFSDDKNAINRKVDKFITKFKWLDDCHVIYKREGYDNGIMVSYKFEKYNNLWFLINIIDEST